MDTLREENARIRAQQAWEEQQRRQMQMSAKLDAMRMRKHVRLWFDRLVIGKASLQEMLQAQREEALQRFQQHQMQLHMRRQQATQMQQQHQQVPHSSACMQNCLRAMSTSAASMSFAPPTTAQQMMPQQQQMYATNPLSQPDLSAFTMQVRVL